MELASRRENEYSNDAIPVFLRATIGPGRESDFVPLLVEIRATHRRRRNLQLK